MFVQNIRILRILTGPKKYSNLENYAFDAKYSDLEYFDCGLPINKIAPMLCIYEIFTDNFAVPVVKHRVPVHHLSSQ
jgi:hypothetical protein